MTHVPNMHATAIAEKLNQIVHDPALKAMPHLHALILAGRIVINRLTFNLSKQEVELLNDCLQAVPASDEKCLELACHAVTPRRTVRAEIPLVRSNDSPVRCAPDTETCTKPAAYLESWFFNRQSPQG